ncbi:MAG: M23 family metallopeptidase [Rhodobacteraceae bacterium]|nr:M23 family metallopeptidase [Paracoccaceae bacterium]
MADPPSLSLPIDCVLGQDCFIQQYVDHDPGPDALDFTCGSRSYDGHKGTDIRVAHIATIKGSGVAVLAAAPGKVLATRDAMPDIAQYSPNAPDIAGKECGNGVLIDHGDGWHSQYCHMRKDSISVTAGDRVDRGQPMGLVGLSGLTEFPHLHIKISEGERLVDPFHPTDITTCGDDPPQLWAKPIAYAPGGIMALGFASSAVDYETVRNGPISPETLTVDAPAITIWGYFYGLSRGDEIQISIRMPDGGILTEHSETVSRDRAEAYRFIGKKRTASTWPKGRYDGTVEILRGNQMLDQRTAHITID